MIFQLGIYFYSFISSSVFFLFSLLVYLLCLYFCETWWIYFYFFIELTLLSRTSLKPWTFINISSAFGMERVTVPWKSFEESLIYIWRNFWTIYFVIWTRQGVARKQAINGWLHNFFKQYYFPFIYCCLLRQPNLTVWYFLQLFFWMLPNQ